MCVASSRVADEIKLGEARLDRVELLYQHSERQRASSHHDNRGVPRALVAGLLAVGVFAASGEELLDAALLLLRLTSVTAALLTGGGGVAMAAELRDAAAAALAARCSRCAAA